MTRRELIEVFRLAESLGAPVFVHARSSGLKDPGSGFESVAELVGAAAVTGASVHVVHVNSTCMKDALECIAMMSGARKRGIDVTTEGYPYTAGMTLINSALFQSGMAGETRARLRRSRTPGDRRAAHQGKVRRPPCRDHGPPDPDPYQPGKRRERSHDRAFRHHCKRRHRAPPARRGHACQGPRAICPRTEIDLPHGCDPEDVADAGPATRAS